MAKIKSAVLTLLFPAAALMLEIPPLGALLLLKQGKKLL